VLGKHVRLIPAIARAERAERVVREQSRPAARRAITDG
jgi:hypothetical protein